MALEIVRGDLVKMDADVIVNAANSRLEMGGGVCGAIFSAAGPSELAAECRRIGRCGVGEAVITSGCGLKAKYVIHTVGPIWQGGGKNEESLLRSCYFSSLKLAVEYRCRSIAFPLISSGIFGYPKEKAQETAVSAIESFLQERDIAVYLVLFG